MKNSPLKRATALLTSLALTIGFTISECAAYGAGTELHKSVTTISDNADFVNRVSTHSSGRQESFFFSYTPGGNVIPVVGYGNQVYGRQNITTAANQLASQGVYVLGGVNADFFSFSTGVPMGLTIADGKLITDAAGRAAIAFRQDGSAFLTQPTFSFQLTNNGGGDPATSLGGNHSNHTGQTVTANYYNKYRQPHAIYLLSSDFAATNMVSTKGRDVLMRIVSGEVMTSGTVELEVAKVTESATATTIPNGYLLLTADAQAGKYADLTKFAVGDSVTLQISNNDPRLDEAVGSIGGGDVLIKNGAITSASGWEKDVSTSRNPRTAIGIKENGTVVVYAIDGRISGHSVGLTLQELAEEMLSMGCKTVLNLDGGGSTSVLYRKPDGASDVYSMINKPSDGSARKCSSFLFLTTKEQGDGTANTLYFTPNDPIVLAGSTVKFSKLTARDYGYRPSELPDAQLQTFTANSGTIASDLTYTAAKTAGKDTVTVSGDGFSGSTTVTVVDGLDALAVKRVDTGKTITSMTMSYDSKVKLSGVGTAKGVTVLSSSEAYTYKVSGDIGKVDTNGELTVTGKAGSKGTVTVSGGGKSATIEVTVSALKPTLISDFEDGLLNGNTASMTDASADVKRGLQAGVLNYDVSDFEESATEQMFYLPEAVSFASAPSRFSCWVKGDASGVKLGVVWQNDSGEKTIIPFDQAIDFTDYKLLTTKTGLSGSGKVVALAITGTTAKSGKLIVDQLTAPGDFDPAEENSPVIDMKYAGGALTATLSDDTGATFTDKDVTVTVDGKETAFTLSDNKLSAKISISPTSMHRIAIKASDAFGNLTRTGINVAATGLTSGFTDVSDSFWGAGYIRYLSDKGIITGVGNDKFDPNGKMTRAAFCTMLTRYLELDTDPYEYEPMPFDDLNNIPAWSLSSVKAMYALGYVGGRQSGNKLLFAPNDSITRAEIFTLIGRLNEKGYAGACKTTFTDQSTIPAWALDGVKTTVGMGVVKGYEDGTIRVGNNATRAEVASLLFNCF